MIEIRSTIRPRVRPSKPVLVASGFHVFDLIRRIGATVLCPNVLAKFMGIAKR